MGSKSSVSGTTSCVDALIFCNPRGMYWHTPKPHLIKLYLMHEIAGSKDTPLRELT